MSKLRVWVFCALLLGLTVAGWADELVVTSVPESVTLYRGSALVTRSVTLPKTTGELALVVEDLPNAVQPASLAAASLDGIKVRSVRYRQKKVDVAPDKATAELDEKIKRLQRELFVTGQHLQAVQQRETYLNKLENFTAPTVNVEITKGVLNPKSLAEMSEFLFKQRNQLLEKRIELTHQRADQKKDLTSLQRKRKKLGPRTQRTIRQAILFVTKAKAGPAKLHLNYLVRQAGWSPAYTVRLSENRKSVLLDYVAHAHQTSGENWSNVKLTLSTATPHMNAEVPLLAPMFVRLQPWRKKESGKRRGSRSLGGMPPSAMPSPQQAAGQTMHGKSMDQPQFNYMLGRMRARNAAMIQKGLQDQGKLGWELNRLALGAQNWEFNVDQKRLTEWYRDVRAEEEALAVTYAVESPIRLASRAGVQLVPLLHKTLPAESYYQATPLLASFVFQGAKVKNTTGQPLLAGRYSAYVGEEFVGGGQLPVIAKGQEISLGFGIDTQLRCRRELKKKTDKTFLGSRTQTFTYELILESFKDKPVEVRLLDRMPVTRNENLKIQLAKTSLPVSTNADYVDGPREKGLLRWDVSVPAEAIGAKALKMTYSIEMKYAAKDRIGRRIWASEAESNDAYKRMLRKKR